MKNFLLMSVLIITLVIPIRASRMKNPVWGLKRALLYFLAFNAFYLFALLFIYPRL
jgi:hypothetical protein